MSYLSDGVRSQSAQRMRDAADLLDAGHETDAGKTLLAGLKPVARDLKRTFGPIIRVMAKGWIRSIFDEEEED